MRMLYPNSLSYHDTSFTKVGDSMMPAPESTMEEWVSPMKSVETTASEVKLQRGGEEAGRARGVAVTLGLLAETRGRGQN